MTENVSATGKVAWFSAILRHFTTIVMIIAAFWWLGKPRAQEFINSAVDDRISKVEKGIDQLKAQGWDQSRNLADVKKKQTEQQEQLDVILQQLAEVRRQIRQQEANP